MKVFECSTHGSVSVSERFYDDHHLDERGMFCSICILDAPDVDPEPMTERVPAPQDHRVRGEA